MVGEDRVEDIDKKGNCPLGKCFSDLFGIPFEPTALSNVRPLTALEPRRGW
jgi:hypothetical protein